MVTGSGHLTTTLVLSWISPFAHHHRPPHPSPAHLLSGAVMATMRRSHPFRHTGLHRLTMSRVDLRTTVSRFLSGCGTRASGVMMKLCSAPAVLPTVMSLCLTSSPSPRQSSWHSTFRPSWRMPTPCLPGRGRAPRLTDRRHLISLPPSVLNMVTWHVASRLLLTTSSAFLCMVIMGVSLAMMILPVMTTRRAPVRVALSTHA